MSDTPNEQQPAPVSEVLSDDALEQVAGGLGDTATHEIVAGAPKKKSAIWSDATGHFD